ncbi:hypothetical protein AK830_g7983 [Neonectria ditissima]|uniref:Uncharacterized protein n=1 Tax=Neonectria ditissima TaxID=78410 RepID=A0A0P7ALC1_9HYPO|nr:hypothetical protein AK830_g7983 [Neonectria ditissima]
MWHRWQDESRQHVPCVMGGGGLRGSRDRYLPPRWISSLFITLDAKITTTEALHATGEYHDGEQGDSLTIQRIFNGWINPEDLAPMPQCVAEQDQSTWLKTMTKCTHQRCTSHFGIICAHHQWLTQLSCLSTEFSPNVIRHYLPYCSRSVLSKAQLYHWIRRTTGRTWLVDVGDANGLQTLSPASLTRGYAAVDTTYKAPTCLTGSRSAPSREPFHHVLGSCSFAANSQRTGNSARPWEYSTSRRSMVALGFETIGYNLTGHSIKQGDYFDKECFCNVFAMDRKQEPCSDPGQIDLTMERLWLNATCGPASLPDNWTDKLKTTGFAYIPIRDWHWPKYFEEMPRQVLERTAHCATDFCELDSGGYCKVKHAVDRACFCRDLSYESCGGLCHVFDTRIDYVEWLHDLCGNVPDWHGLPVNWRQLAIPTTLELIPWRWTLKPSNDSNIAHSSDSRTIKATELYSLNEWKLGSFALINLATLLTAILRRGQGNHQTARGSSSSPRQQSWFFMGILNAVIQLLAICLNVFLVQNTPGYEDIPAVQLMLLWCSAPRLGWLTILPIGVQVFETINFSAAASSFLAELILQCFSSYYMIRTVSYGLEHNIYFMSLEDAERGRSANIMYAGALMWLIIVIAALGQSMRAMYRMNKLTGPGTTDLPKWQRRNETTSNIAEELVAQSNDYWTRMGEKFVYCWMEGGKTLGELSLTGGEGENYTVYGTLPVERKGSPDFRKAVSKLYMATATGMLLLWVAQWLFWGGFITLSSEEFCPPNLGILTAVWIVFSLASAALSATV